MPRLFPSTPYFDDYNEDKLFQRILFKPGKAVQARELTQLQTISQKQIERLGDHVFKNGSIVTNCNFFLDLKLPYVKIQDLDSTSSPVDLSLIQRGHTLTGLSSGVSGYVIATENGLQTVANTKTLFFKYTSANETTKTFSDGEQIEVRNDTGSLVTTVVSLNSSSTGFGSSFALGEGIVYINGMFLKHLAQTIILDRYTTTPSFKLGIRLSESVITSDDDESLLDPALGSSNYFASGADRYKVETVLTKVGLDEEEPPEFFLLYEVENGVEKRSLQKSQYNELLDALAQRTFDESGDYTVKPFSIRIREHLDSGTNGGLYYANTNPLFTGNISGNAELLSVGVEPGIAYVKGYKVENNITEYLTIDKGTEFAAEEAQPISFGYGNYVLCNELSGLFDIDNGANVSLRNSAADSLTNKTFGATAAPGAQIGTARVKSVEFETGNIGLPDGEYRVYLYDIRMDSGESFSNVRSITQSSTSSLADIKLTSGSAELQETNFNVGVFRFPQRAIKRLRASDGSIDNSWEFKKTFSDITIATNGTFSITSSVEDEVFPFGSGALNATQKRENFVLVLDESGTTTNLPGTISTSTSSNLITGGSTTFSTSFKAGDILRTAGTRTYRIANVVSNTQLYIVDSTAAANESSVTYQKLFQKGEIIDLGETGSDGTTRSVTITSDTVAEVDIQESLSSTISAKVLVNLQKTDGQEIQKTLRKNRFVKVDCTSDTSGTYNLGFSDVYRIVGIYHGLDYSENNTDVTNQFVFDNGQRDNFYSHGRIIKKAGSTLSLTSSSRLLVKLDYFYHDTSSGVGFFSVDSYPIDDTEAEANSIKTENIPIFTSPITGITYDLRDCIDIRPRFSDTAADATSAASATVNPSAPSGSSSFAVPSGGLRVPAPNQEFNTDLEYYLSRIDRVYIDKSNQFGVVRGLPAVFPNPPEEPAVGMTLALINIPPYPSLSPQTAKAANRFDYMTSSKLIDNRRYTMKDIGAINQRISRLEYYTALSFLEKQAEDLVIPSDVTGLDRFKNGFLVDSFNGHGVGNVYDPNYKIAVDPTKQELRPYFLIDNLDFEFDSSQSTNVLRAPRDAALTLTSISGTFVRGQTITQSSVTATVDHFVGSKLYVSNVSGTFSVSAGITATGGASGTVANVSIPTEGDLVTLPYTHAVYAQNPYATRPRNCVGDLLFNYVGEIELNPPGDNWVDTRTNPDLVVNFDNNLDNWLALEEAWGTQWDDWNTDWGGWSTTDQVVAGATSVRGLDVVQNQQTISVQERTGSQTRSGTQLNVTAETVTYNLGNRLVNVNLAAFMRSQLITFNAIRLKPNTRVYPYFDGEPVSEYVRPLGGRFGDALITDSEGGLVGQFQIPNNNTIRFRVGQRLFRLTDDAENRTRFSTTSATAEYTSFGIQQTQETTILSTRQARLAVNSVSDSRTVSQQRVSVSEPTERVVGQVPVVTVTDNGGDGGDGGSDPIAQTFIVENTGGYGMFLSKIDLFFRTKHPTLPITLQVREVINGTIGPRILPFGSVTMYPADINVSEDASAATPFIFPAPIHLQDGVEYCFVAIPAGDNPGYNIWVSELGENQVGTTTRVSEQPYIGVLFTSANNRTWTPFQAEDIKFTLYRANFDTSVNASAVLSNDDSDYLAITNLSGGEFGVGDNVQYSSGTAFVKEYDTINDVIVLKKYGNGRVRTKVQSEGTINCNTSSNVVTGVGTLFGTTAYANAAIYSSNLTTRLGNVASVVDDTTIYLKENAAANCESNVVIIYDEIFNTSNVGIKATVESINEKFITLFDTNLQFLNFIVTEDEWSYKIRDASSNTISSSYIRFLLNENTELVSEAKVSSNSTEDVLFSNTKSMSVKVDFNTRSPFVSPALDLFKPSAIVVRNQINNDATNETTNQGNALSRYISKQVILDDGQDAEDLKVYLTGYKPSSTDIKVYARILNANDGSPFNEVDYIELERVTSSIVISSSKNDRDFKEYEYKFPDSVLTGPNGEVQYTSPDGKVYTGYKYFAIKIVLLSPNKAVVPKVKDYRAIALQI